MLVADGDRARRRGSAARPHPRRRRRSRPQVSTSSDIKNQVMLTGDRRRAAEVIAREVGIPNVEAELLPEQKLDRVRQLACARPHVAMVGDGINDAPALAAASVGIAVAGASDITAEAADVVYLPHSLETLPKLFEVSRKAVQTAWQNIILFAGVVNAARRRAVRHRKAEARSARRSPISSRRSS